MYIFYFKAALLSLLKYNVIAETQKVALWKETASQNIIYKGLIVDDENGAKMKMVAKRASKVEWKNIFWSSNAFRK